MGLNNLEVLGIVVIAFFAIPVIVGAICAFFDVVPPKLGLILGYCVIYCIPAFLVFALLRKIVLSIA